MLDQFEAIFESISGPNTSQTCIVFCCFLDLVRVLMSANDAIV